MAHHTRHMGDSIYQTAECLCGRLQAREHCPNCGSYQLLGYARRETVNRGHGVVAHLKAYRCRRCAEIFNDDDWRLNCHASAYRPRGRPRKLTVKVDTIEERAQLLEYLREVQKLRSL